MNETVAQVLERTARQHTNRPALRVKRGGAWQTTTWAEYREQALAVATGIAGLGLEPGRGVAILSANRPEWLLADVGAIVAGGVPAGIYTTSTAEQGRYVARHCAAAVVVVEHPGYLEWFAGRDDLPALRALVLMEGATDTPGVYSWAQLLERGRRAASQDIAQRLAAQSPADVATLIYTSGTTGPPKAVMLTHRNLTWITEQIAGLFVATCEERSVSYLPLSHVAEQLASIHLPM